MGTGKPNGRPPIYTEEMAHEVCTRLAEGQTLNEICRDKHTPSKQTVTQWVLKDVSGFADRYAQAREAGYHVLADEVLEIADDGRNDWMERNGQDDKGWELNGEHFQRSRLRVDSRKWMLSKVLPKIYGDRVDVNARVENQAPDVAEIAKYVTFLLSGATVQGGELESTQVIEDKGQSQD